MSSDLSGRSARAHVKANGRFHMLGHTFCSHLAMKGAPVLSIRKLAGHQNMQTTLRYIHLAPGKTHRAIVLLEGPNDSAPSNQNAVDRDETITNVIKFPNYQK